MKTEGYYCTLGYSTSSVDLIISIFGRDTLLHKKLLSVEFSENKTPTFHTSLLIFMHIFFHVGGPL
jgi:hypothetical protein